MAASPAIRVRLTPQLAASLERAEKKTGKSVSQIVRESLTETLGIKRVEPMRSPGKPANPEKLSE